MSTTPDRPHPKLPKGLVYCEQCGEPRSRAVDRSYKLKAGETDADRTFKVLCYCRAIECPQCGKQTRHRPLSEYYDVYTKSFVHVPSFAYLQPCRDCRRRADTSRVLP